MMKRTWIALTSILGLVSASALAQPILDRVEQQIRRAAVNPTEPGYLGVIANDRQDQGGEVRVLQVIAAGPAAKAGMQTDDLITSINGQPVRSMDEMARALERQPVGAKLTVTVTRQGADRQLEVVLGRRPQSRPTGRVPDELPSPLAPSADNTPPQGPRLGVQTLPVTDEARRQNGLPSAAGAMVLSVTVGGPADRAGVPLGAVITALDGQPIGTPQDLASAVRRAGAREVELTYLNRGQETRSRILLSSDPLPSDGPKLELRSRPLGVPDPAQPSADPFVDSPDDSRTAALEARIRELEERIAKLEAALAGDKK
jgi:S1-C subfamily serine protease